MRKNKLFLSLIAVCSIVGMGITSCNSEPVQGPQGEQGPVGPQGPAGENGENGEDGSLILHGEGKPADTLGKDTDVYIDSKTGDLYQKENGSWTLVMNIKGEDGQDGHDGSDGLNGSNGEDGKTAWSNTILPSEDGYILPSLGSATVGETVTFTFVPNSNSEGTDLSKVIWTINGEKMLGNDDGTISKNMIEGGYVVSAYIEENLTETVTTKEQLETTINSIKTNQTAIIPISGDISLDNLNLNAPSGVTGASLTLLGTNNESNIDLNNVGTINGFKDVTLENIDLNVKGAEGITDDYSWVINCNADDLTLSNVNIDVDDNIDKKLDIIYTYGKNITLNNVKTNKDDADEGRLESIVEVITTSNPALENITIKDSELYGSEVLQCQKIGPNFKFNLDNSYIYTTSTIGFFFADYGLSNPDEVKISFNLNNSEYESADPSKFASLIQFNSWGSLNNYTGDYSKESLENYIKSESEENKIFKDTGFNGNLSNLKINANNFTLNKKKITPTTDISYHLDPKYYVAMYTNGTGSIRTRFLSSQSTLFSLMGAVWGESGYTFLAGISNTSLYPTITIDGTVIEKDKLVTPETL